MSNDKFMIHFADYDGDVVAMPLRNILGVATKVRQDDDSQQNVATMLLETDGGVQTLPLKDAQSTIEIANTIREQGYPIDFGTDARSGQVAWFRADKVEFVTRLKIDDIDQKITQVGLGARENGPFGPSPEGVHLTETVEEVVASVNAAIHAKQEAPQPA